MVGFNPGTVATDNIDSGENSSLDYSVWDDVTQAAIGRRLFSVTGKVDYDYDESAIKFQSGGSISNSSDRIVSAVQYPHKAVIGVNACLRPHIHFEQTTANSVVFTMQYRVQNNGEAKNSTWTTVTATVGTDTVWTYPGSGTFNNILKFPEIDMSGADISSTIQFRLARTDSTGGDVLVTFMDMHVPFDTMGSKQEYIKRG